MIGFCHLEDYARAREVFVRGQKAVEVIGPVPAVEDEIAALHRDFWCR